MAFGTIMLNTDAHNIQVRNKMTEKQFIENTQFIAGGEKIPANFLIDLYGRIQNEEIMLEPEKSCFPNACMKAWMWLHTKNSRWKRRWVVLSDNSIYICKKPAVCIYPKNGLYNVLKELLIIVVFLLPGNVSIDGNQFSWMYCGKS